MRNYPKESGRPERLLRQMSCRGILRKDRTDDLNAGKVFSLDLRTVPLLRALLPLIAGIMAGAYLNVPLYCWTVAAAVCIALAALGKKSNFTVLYANMALLFFGAMMIGARSPRAVMPRGERIWIEAHVTDNPAAGSGRSARTSAIATRWRTEEGEWMRGGEKLLVSFDTVYSFGPGDRIIFRGYVNPLSETETSYSRLMKARGFSGRTHISEHSRAVATTSGVKSLPARFKSLQRIATRRLHRLDMGAYELAVATAMTTGDRSAVTPELRRSYSRVGASHLLAVSGLHVGIVFLVINVLLYLLPLFRYGHIIKSAAAVCVIWLYAAMTGMSPSVIRAAFMFTGAQAALSLSATRSAVNIMCGTAFIMLAVHPGMLFDISFQLSFIAVGAITAWFGPLYRLVESRWKILNALWSVLIVGFTASVATMPLVSHTFGVISPAGFVLNPVVIFTAHLIVMFCLLWILVPAPFLEPLFGWLAGGPAWLQNKIVEAVAEIPAAAVEYTIPLGWMLAVYAVIIIFTVCLAARPKKAEPFVLPV